ncbi:hypothetical protein TH25_17280 [Thalassospira profundimaris]|uniref:Uncharacterized protein n=1 Tax=Thalassospira profundimaris TaxID=502049 RepID=A0A367WZ14_9PROT|nr:hypothetical protein [Thalassospira profundimaris]RCK45980.1 hypothetical protein TH25_17280 [Thalassospira profundimaris]
MRNTFRALAVIGGLFAATSLALADEQQPRQPEGQMPGMMQGKNGMSGMMQMMQQMGPMMEQCREMMAAMTEQIKSRSHAPDSHDG